MSNVIFFDDVIDNFVMVFKLVNEMFLFVKYRKI